MTPLQESCLATIKEQLSPAYAAMLTSLVDDLTKGLHGMTKARKTSRYRVDSDKCQTILDRLQKGPASVNELRDISGQNNTNHALESLVEAGLVEKTAKACPPRGISAVYALTQDSIPSVRASA